MCSYLDQVIERGRIAGYVEGFAEGYAEGFPEGFSEGFAERFAEGIVEEKHNIITRMLTISPVESVVKIGGFTYDEVKLVYDEMLQTGPVPCES